MKKRFAAIALASALALFTLPVLAFAAGSQGESPTSVVGAQCAAGCVSAASNAAGKGGAFVDANADGVCDNFGTRTAFADANVDGVCDNRSERAGFVDANGDGTCDNFGTCAGASGSCGNGAHDGRGNALGQGGGNGNGACVRQARQL